MNFQRKKTRDAAGQEVDAVVVPVAETVERASTTTLEDGTILRVRVSVDEALRLEGQYDDEGNPIYMVKSATLIGVASVPDELKRRTH